MRTSCSAAERVARRVRTEQLSTSYLALTVSLILRGSSDEGGATFFAALPLVAVLQLCYFAQRDADRNVRRRGVGQFLRCSDRQ